MDARGRSDSLLPPTGGHHNLCHRPAALLPMHSRTTTVTTEERSNRPSGSRAPPDPLATYAPVAPIPADVRPMCPSRTATSGPLRRSGGPQPPLSRPRRRHPAVAGRIGHGGCRAEAALLCNALFQGVLGNPPKPQARLVGLPRSRRALPRPPSGEIARRPEPTRSAHDHASETRPTPPGYHRQPRAPSSTSRRNPRR